MADSKNDLKRVDAEKSFGSGSQNTIVDVVAAKAGGVGSKASRLSVKRRIPVVLDVIIGIIVLAIFAGAVAGAYFLFRYYTEDYEGIDIEYVFISPCSEERDAFRTVKNKEIYYDADGNTEYFGKVSEMDVVDSYDSGRYLVLNVSATAKYKAGEGYSVGDYRIAVGSEFSFRTDGRVFEGVVVELRERAEINGTPLSVDLEETEREAE